MNLRQTLVLKPITIEEISAWLDRVIPEADQDSKTYADMCQMKHDIELQLARQRAAENQRTSTGKKIRKRKHGH